MSRIAKVGTLALGAGAVVLSMHGVAAADADAKAAAFNSSGLMSGNVIQVPIHAPINVCGSTVGGIGTLNRAAGISCENKEGEKKHEAHDKKSDKKDLKKHAEKQHKAHDKKDLKKHADKQHKAHDKKSDKKSDKKGLKRLAEKVHEVYGH